MPTSIFNQHCLAPHITGRETHDSAFFFFFKLTRLMYLKWQQIEKGNLYFNICNVSNIRCVCLPKERKWPRLRKFSYTWLGFTWGGNALIDTFSIWLSRSNLVLHEGDHQCQIGKNHCPKIRTFMFANIYALKISFLAICCGQNRTLPQAAFCLAVKNCSVHVTESIGGHWKRDPKRVHLRSDKLEKKRNTNLMIKTCIHMCQSGW